MRATDGLLVDVARSVARDHPQLEFEERAVDLVAMQLVRDPARFDVLVIVNMYGDILSDLAAGLTGGIGFAPEANFGDDLAVFEPAHGSAPKYAHEDRANPIAAILSGAMLARHLGEDATASGSSVQWRARSPTPGCRRPTARAQTCVPPRRPL